MIRAGALGWEMASGELASRNDIGGNVLVMFGELADRTALTHLGKTGVKIKIRARKVGFPSSPSLSLGE